MCDFFSHGWSSFLFASRRQCDCESYVHFVSRGSSCHDTVTKFELKRVLTSFKNELYLEQCCSTLSRTSKNGMKLLFFHSGEMTSTERPFHFLRAYHSFLWFCVSFWFREKYLKSWLIVVIRK